MKNVEMNKTKGMSMDETVLMFGKKLDAWVITYLQVSQPGQLEKSLTHLIIN